ncbi:MAG TPA: aminoglycoside phosphotransferase [Jiangellales bacterium]|nr:aminoglycoside phosphotransferase [Jiangellales bacterium]
MTDRPVGATTDPRVEDVARLLVPWLHAQRWFAGKDRAVDGVQVVAASLLRESGPRVWHLVVDVDQAGAHTLYQVPVSLRDEHVDRLEHVFIGEAGGLAVYDALHDKDATAEIARRIDGEQGTELLDFHREPGAEVPVDAPSIVLTGEQSNTSLVYGDIALLKVFRRIAPGTNPDVEIHDALTRAGCEHVAALLGWVDGRWTDPTTGRQEQAGLAMLQTFLVTATDGWRLATTSVRDLYAEGDLHADEVGGDFAGESRRLGLATAEVHRVMAEVLPSGELDAAALRAMAVAMRGRLEAALEVVPTLRPYAAALNSAYDDVAELPGPVPVQRIHGDYHLGQVMRTVRGWKLLDFEGEPEKPLAERVQLDSPVRDVAGMLRSFDYAARHLLVADHPGSEQIAYRATEWAERNRESFCDGYAAGAGWDPRDQRALLRAYETDKVVYEAVYEARNRPAWLPIPLAAVERLAPASTPEELP